MSFFANQVGYVHDNKIVLFHPKETSFFLEEIKTFRLVKSYHNRNIIISAIIIICILGINLSLGLVDFYQWVVFILISAILLYYSFKRRVRYTLIIKSIDAPVTKIVVSNDHKDSVKKIVEYIFKLKEIEKRSRKQAKE